MSKSRDIKKDSKKKPSKSLKEKKEAKRLKKLAREGFSIDTFRKVLIK